MCPARALFTTPDGERGIFIELPASGDELPYLFVAAVGERAAGAGRVAVAFDRDEIGGLDKEFVEESVCSEPQRAWRTFEAFGAGGGGEAAAAPEAARVPAADLLGESDEGGGDDDFDDDEEARLEEESARAEAEAEARWEAEQDVHVEYGLSPRRR